MHFFKKIENIYKNFLSIIGKNNTNSFMFTSATTKQTMTSSCTLKLSSETENKKKEINEKLKPLIKKYMDAPEKLIQYMQLKGYSVYKFNNANKLLEKLGEEEGFLTPLRGFKAFVLNLIIGALFEKKLKISFSTKEMFIFNVGAVEIYTIARALHKYQGFKNNLPGYDYKSQETFKRVYQNSKYTNISPFANCTIKDMYACKEAIARDLESINFTVQLSVEYQQAKKALTKLKETSSTSV